MFNARKLSCCALSTTLLPLAILAPFAVKPQKKTAKTSPPAAKSSSPLLPRVSDPVVRLTRNALSYRGVRYRWGGASRRGTDCSGLTLQVFAREGFRLPHNARAQYRLGKPVRFEDLQPGDLVFFNIRRKLGHVGIYIGEGRFVHASTPRTGVRIDSLNGSYRRTFAGARRLIQTPKAPKNAEHLPPEIEPLLQPDDTDSSAPSDSTEG